MSFRNIDLSIVLKDVAKKAVITEVPYIRRAITYNKGDDVMLKTDGINMVVRTLVIHQLQIFQFRKKLLPKIIKFDSKTHVNMFFQS